MEPLDCGKPGHAIRRETCAECYEDKSRLLECMTEHRDAAVSTAALWRKDLEDAKLQLSEVTAHRDRLRDMLNDVRGMIFTDQSAELVRRILHRIDPVDDIFVDDVEKGSCDHDFKPSPGEKLLVCDRCGRRES